MPARSTFHDALAEAVRGMGVKVVEVDQTKDGILVLDLATPQQVQIAAKRYATPSRKSDTHRILRVRVDGTPVIFRAELAGGRS